MIEMAEQEEVIMKLEVNETGKEKEIEIETDITKKETDTWKININPKEKGKENLDSLLIKEWNPLEEEPEELYFL